MNNLLNLAEQYYNLAKNAGRKTRKMIEKELLDNKNKYNTRRLSLQDKRKQYNDLANIIDYETKDMNAARDYMQKAYDVLKHMDMIPDVNEVRFFDDDRGVAYIKKHRLYKLKDDGEGNIELEPFHTKKIKNQEENIDDEASAADASLSDEEDLADADDLLNSLMD